MKTEGKYILTRHIPIPCDDLMVWANWFETAKRHVASDHIGKVYISTVFLGIDHSFGIGEPLLFETMIFGGKHHDYQTRCSTWEEAEKMHKKALKLVKSDTPTTPAEKEKR